MAVDERISELDPVLTPLLTDQIPCTPVADDGVLSLKYTMQQIKTISNTNPTIVGTLITGGKRIIKRVALTGNSNTTTAGDAELYGYTSTSSAFTFTIQTADITDGWEFTVKDESGAAGTNNITIATQGAQTIDGESSASITVDNGAIRLYTDGTNVFTK